MPAFENLSPLSTLIIMHVFKDVHGPSLFCSVSSSNLLQHCLEKFIVYFIFFTSSNYSRPKDLNTIHLVDNSTCYFHNVDSFRPRPIHLDLPSGTHSCSPCCGSISSGQEYNDYQRIGTSLPRQGRQWHDQWCPAMHTVYRPNDRKAQQQSWPTAGCFLDPDDFP